MRRYGLLPFARNDGSLPIKELPMDTSPLILLAAGGTGGHLFPAEALGVELIKRGYRVHLATEARALRYSGLFSKDMIDVVPSETVRGRSPFSLAYTGIKLAAGTLVALKLIRRLKPAAVVGFGGYPTLPPLMAARLLGVPGIIHDANAVLGRANRFLASRVSAIATSLPGVLDRDPALAGKATTVGTPMRPAILAAAAIPFASPGPHAPGAAGPPSWCRGPARSIRTSPPMPACWPRSTGRCASRRRSSRRTVWRPKFPHLPPSPHN